MDPTRTADMNTGKTLHLLAGIDTLPEVFAFMEAIAADHSLPV